MDGRQKFIDCTYPTFQLQTRLQNTVVEDKVSLLEEIDSLKAKLDILNKDITELSKE